MYEGIMRCVWHGENNGYIEYLFRIKRNKLCIICYFDIGIAPVFKFENIIKSWKKWKERKKANTERQMKQGNKPKNILCTYIIF